MDEPNCRDLISELAQGLGIGEVVENTSDGLVTIWNQKYIYNARHFRQAQRKYGTGNVHHIPHPLLAVKVTKSLKRESFLLITDQSGLNDNTISHLRRHLERKFVKLRIVSQTSLTPTMVLKLFPKVSAILFYAALHDELYYYMALAARTPFVIRYQPEDQNLIDLLSVWNLNLCLAPSSEYYVVKNSLRLLLKHRELVTSRIDSGVKNARLKLKWASSIRGIRNVRRPLPGKGTLNLYVNPFDYEGRLATLATSLAIHNHENGYHFELDVGTTFLDQNSVYYHMWLGLIWETDIGVLEQLVSHPAFGLSASYCLGLLVTNQNTLITLRGLLDGYGFGICLVNCQDWLSDDMLIHGLTGSHLSRRLRSRP